MEEINRYTDRFKLVDGCLTEMRLTRKGIVEKKLCNFAPFMCNIRYRAEKTLLRLQKREARTVTQPIPRRYM